MYDLLQKNGIAPDNVPLWGAKLEGRKKPLARAVAGPKNSSDWVFIGYLLGIDWERATADGLCSPGSGYDCGRKDKNPGHLSTSGVFICFKLRERNNEQGRMWTL